MSLKLTSIKDCLRNLTLWLNEPTFFNILVKKNLLISVGLAGGGGAEPLLAGNGANGGIAENGTMSNMSVGFFGDMPFPCKYE